MIMRPTIPADTPKLLDLARLTGAFKPMEIQALREVLDDYHQSNQALGHRAVTGEETNDIIAFIYYAPAAMTERTWYLYWIVVGKDWQGKGIGSTLLHAAEADIRARQGRLLFIETSSLPEYQAARHFYEKHHFDPHAVLRDFYSPGDSMIVFRKAFE